jgi:hypothetical protein
MSWIHLSVSFNAFLGMSWGDLYLSTGKFMYLGTKVNILNGVKGKGKAIPLQAWTGPEGSRRLRLPNFKTVGT